MANRSEDWLAQAEADLAHAGTAARAGDHEWACFAAQQAAEKALRAVALALGGEGWGHSVLRLLRAIGERVEVPGGLESAARRLDRHYIPTRYPNGYDAGFPHEYYEARDAEEAIADAQRLVAFARRHVAGR